MPPWRHDDVFFEEYDAVSQVSSNRVIRGFFGTASFGEYVNQIVKFYKKPKQFVVVSGEVRQGHTPEGECIVERYGVNLGGSWDWAFSQSYYRFYHYDWTRFHLYIQNCMDWASEVMLERNLGEL